MFATTAGKRFRWNALRRHGQPCGESALLGLAWCCRPADERCRRISVRFRGPAFWLLIHEVPMVASGLIDTPENYMAIIEAFATHLRRTGGPPPRSFQWRGKVHVPSRAQRKFAVAMVERTLARVG